MDEYKSISELINKFEKQFLNKLKEKNDIILKLTEENKVLKEQINIKKPKKIKNKKKNNLSDLLKDNNGAIDLSNTFKKSAQVKEASEFFDKEYKNYLNNLNGKNKC